MEILSCRDNLNFLVAAQKFPILSKHFLVAAQKILILVKILRFVRAITPLFHLAGTIMVCWFFFLNDPIAPMHGEIFFDLISFILWQLQK